MTKGCYTCRRRRITCDNGLPTCRKCRDAGKECLGYQKPLVWVKGGVASRGKMMGRSFDDVIKKPPHTEINSFGSSNGPGTGTREPNPLNEWQEDQDFGGNSSSIDIQPAFGDFGSLDNNSLVVYTGDTIAAADYNPTPWGLVDPLLKDLSPLSRFYIYHYNQNMSALLTLYPDARNPYRDLTSLIGDSPVLAHALTALGALHYALLYHEEFTPEPWSSSSSTNTAPMSLQELGSAVLNSVARRPASKNYEQFLSFKQHALSQLSLDIRNPARQNDDKTVAAILVLALLDAVESGSGAWKYHLEGAKNLLKSREQGSRLSHSRDIMDWLDNFAVDGCLIIQLMGSTLARPGTLSQPFYSSTIGPAILKRLEQTSWVGCPAYLLDVIFFVHTRWCEDTDPATAPQPTMAFTSTFLPETPSPLQSPTALLQHIQVFDPISWAEEMQSFVSLPDLSARIALANVYKSAVYLYASRVLSRPRSQSPSPGIKSCTCLPKDHKKIADSLINQLSLIPESDPHFKCLIWPTFIAGAESRFPSQRPIILQLLSTLFYTITSVNVRNAAWVLSLMWRKQDLKRSRSVGLGEGSGLNGGSPNEVDESVCDDYYDDDDDFDWIQELDDSRMDWLFI